jgi:glycosyltransferase involved in cell wall biosynthesis
MSGALAADDGHFVLELETGLPESLAVGAGNILFLSGWCFHRKQKIVQLELQAGHTLYPVTCHSILRPDVAGRFSGQACSERSGFWVLLPIERQDEYEALPLCLRAILSDQTTLKREIGRLKLAQTPRYEAHSGLNKAERVPLVAICMATYNPPLALLRRQVESLINQTHRNWVCVVSDDGSAPETLLGMREILAQDQRFVLSIAPCHLGFYHNFERSLSLAPAAAQFVMMCDQDDYWRAEKIETLLASFDERTLLVYSDMRIVDAERRVLSETYWTARQNNYTDLASLLITNCVTGAAAIFRRELFEWLLPFPERVGDLFHDHWLGCLALAVGEIKYVDRALYDYTQHAGNILGHSAVPPPSLPKLIFGIIRELCLAEGRDRARSVYFEKVLKTEAMARLLLLRAGDCLSKRKRHLLHRLAWLEDSPLNLLWLALRGLKGWRRVSDTVGAEYFLLLGVAWRFYIGLKSRLKDLP